MSINSTDQNAYDFSYLGDSLVKYDSERGISLEPKRQSWSSLSKYLGWLDFIYKFFRNLFYPETRIETVLSGLTLDVHQFSFKDIALGKVLNFARLFKGSVIQKHNEKVSCVRSAISTDALDVAIKEQVKVYTHERSHRVFESYFVEGKDEIIKPDELVSCLIDSIYHQAKSMQAKCESQLAKCMENSKNALEDHSFRKTDESLNQLIKQCTELAEIFEGAQNYNHSNLTETKFDSKTNFDSISGEKKLDQIKKDILKVYKNIIKNKDFQSAIFKNELNRTCFLASLHKISDESLIIEFNEIYANREEDLLSLIYLSQEKMDEIDRQANEKKPDHIKKLEFGHNNLFCYTRHCQLLGAALNADPLLYRQSIQKAWDSGFYHAASLVYFKAFTHYVFLSIKGPNSDLDQKIKDNKFVEDFKGIVKDYAFKMHMQFPKNENYQILAALFDSNSKFALCGLDLFSKIFVNFFSECAIERINLDKLNRNHFGIFENQISSNKNTQLPINPGSSDEKDLTCPQASLEEDDDLGLAQLFQETSPENGVSVSNLLHQKPMSIDQQFRMFKLYLSALKICDASTSLVNVKELIIKRFFIPQIKMDLSDLKEPIDEDTIAKIYDLRNLKYSIIQNFVWDLRTDGFHQRQFSKTDNLILEFEKELRKKIIGKTIFNCEKTNDVKLRLSDSEIILNLHQSVLAQSSYFRSQFKWLEKNRNDLSHDTVTGTSLPIYTIQLDQNRRAAFVALVEYLYTGVITVTADNFLYLDEIASQYDLCPGYLVSYFQSAWVDGLMESLTLPLDPSNEFDLDTLKILFERIEKNGNGLLLEKMSCYLAARINDYYDYYDPTKNSLIKESDEQKMLVEGWLILLEKYGHYIEIYPLQLKQNPSIALLGPLMKNAALFYHPNRSNVFHLSDDQALELNNYNRILRELFRSYRNTFS